MAVLSVQLTVPPKTPESAPVSEIISAPRGLLSKVEIDYKRGCLHVVGIRIMVHGSQVAPWTSGWFYGEAETITSNINYIMQGPPYIIAVQGYSRAADWSHTVNVRLYVE